jgi:hypothetical protein
VHRRPPLLSSLLLVLVGCATRPAQTPGGDQPAPSAPARPAWTQKSVFLAPSLKEAAVYGVGVYEIDRKQEICGSADKMVAAAENRGRAEIGKYLKTITESSAGSSTTASMQVLRSASAQLGWFDGDRTFYVLVKLPWVGGHPPSDPKSELEPTGGTAVLPLKDTVAASNKSALDQTGICQDPHKRMTLACCGKPDTFCSDPSRFDKTNGKICRCGDALPCLYDFKCSTRGATKDAGPSTGPKQCLCAGPKCPCEMLNCKAGQTCQDGRCF